MPSLHTVHRGIGIAEKSKDTPQGFFIKGIQNDRGDIGKGSECGEEGLQVNASFDLDPDLQTDFEHGQPPLSREDLKSTERFCFQLSGKFEGPVPG